ncbi:MAG: hypothetical protein WC784_01450 [Candidatus Shapirobacteria bacterium]|jgi:hypothetical protein
MSDEEANNSPDNRNELANEAEYAARQQGKYYERYGFDASASNVSHLIVDEDTDADFGKDLVAFYFLCQNSPTSGTEISSWELGGVFSALGTRTLENMWLRRNFSKVQGIVTGEVGEINSNPVLKSAVTKQASHVFVDDSSEFHTNENPGLSSDLTPEEMRAYSDYDRAFRAAHQRCLSCGETTGKPMDDWVALSRQKSELDLVLRAPGLSVEVMENLSTRLEIISDKLNQRWVDIKMLDLTMTGASADKENAAWVSLTGAALGISETFASCRQWLTNQSDLDPISKLWIYQGRMTELHPSHLEAMAKEFPSFNEATRGMLALGSWKYALGDNGEIYPSGRYGLGYVDATGQVDDVDRAVTRSPDGRITGLNAGITKLGENQIFVRGEGVVNVVNDKATIANREVTIFSKNILHVDKDTRGRDIKLKDRDVSEFLADMIKFVRGGDKRSADHEIELGIEMAREFFEFSMMANWDGVARDSQRRPYYMLGGDSLTLSSDPESQTVKFGAPINGSSDEATTFPYWAGGDWGKLTQTRAKQISELGKGRKHGLYTLLPFLPENLVQPMLGNDDVEDVLQGQKTMEQVFHEMNANAQFKTYWLNIFKGIAVYEFISSNFVGDKDPEKAEVDLLALLMQPRLLEGLNKDIDLSLFWVDKMEAARLKVNIVLAGLAAVAREFVNEELFGVPGKGDFNGRLAEDITKVNENGINDTSDVDKLKIVLRQLISSRFIGDEKEVMRVVDRLKGYKNGENGLGFSMSEFIGVFGPDYLSRYSVSREERRNKVVSRSKKR